MQANYIDVEPDKDDVNERIEVILAEGDTGEAMRLAIKLGISVLIDNARGHTGAFYIKDDGTQSPLLKEGFGEHESPTIATLTAICRAAHLMINGAGTDQNPWK